MAHLAQKERMEAEQYEQTLRRFQNDDISTAELFSPPVFTEVKKTPEVKGKTSTLNELLEKIETEKAHYLKLDKLLEL